MLTAVREQKRSVSGCGNKKVIIHEYVSCMANQNSYLHRERNNAGGNTCSRSTTGDTCMLFHCYGAQISGVSGVGNYCDPTTAWKTHRNFNWKTSGKWLRIHISVGSFEKHFSLNSPPSYFYDSVVYRWWKTPQVLKSVHYFVIISFLCLGAWSCVDISAGLNLSQSLFCWFLGECCLNGGGGDGEYSLQIHRVRWTDNQGFPFLWRIGLMFLIMSLNPPSLLSA